MYRKVRNFLQLCIVGCIALIVLEFGLTITTQNTGFMVLIPFFVIAIIGIVIALPTLEGAFIPEEWWKENGIRIEATVEKGCIVLADVVG